MNPAAASARIEQFGEIDEQALKDQHLFHNDETALIQSAADTRVEPALLFDTDKASL